MLRAIGAGCPVEGRFVAKFNAGEISGWPPFFPGDRTMVIMCKRDDARSTSSGACYAATRSSMPLKAYYRNDLALLQLQTALRLYFDATDFASVTTLAGAAEEIFGKLLAARGKENSLEALIKAVTAIRVRLFGEADPAIHVVERANLARNSLKHWDANDTEIVKLDLRLEAIDMLNRAIDNYWILEQTLTPEMERFQREILGA